MKQYPINPINLPGINHKNSSILHNRNYSTTISEQNTLKPNNVYLIDYTYLFVGMKLTFAIPIYYDLH